MLNARRRLIWRHLAGPRRGRPEIQGVLNARRRLIWRHSPCPPLSRTRKTCSTPVGDYLEAPLARYLSATSDVWCSTPVGD